MRAIPDTCQCVCSSDIHSTRSTDTFTTRTTECYSWINLVFNFNQCIQHHRPAAKQRKYIKCKKRNGDIISENSRKIFNL